MKLDYLFSNSKTSASVSQHVFQTSTLKTVIKYIAVEFVFTLHEVTLRLNVNDFTNGLETLTPRRSCEVQRSNNATSSQGLPFDIFHEYTLYSEDQEKPRNTNKAPRG